MRNLILHINVAIGDKIQQKLFIFSDRGCKGDIYKQSTKIGNLFENA